MHRARQITAILLKVVALVVTLYVVSLLGLRLAGFEFAAVVSDSMSPAIKQGDLVILKSVDQEDLSVGTIVRYRNHNQFILHRVVSFEHKGFRTKGDANLGPDPKIVRANQIDALAIGTLRGFALPIIYLKRILGFEPHYAKFSRHTSKFSKMESSIWTSPTAKWKQITGGGTYTFLTPSSVTSTGNGNRSIFIIRNVSTDRFFYSKFRLVAKDSNGASIYFNADVCLTGSTITCGWAINISESSQSISLQTYSQSGIRQTPIYSKPLDINLGIEAQIVVHISSSLLQMSIDGTSVLKLPNPGAFALSKGVNVPTGTYFGFSLTNSNQFKSSKTLTW
jgi:signal peptidase I